MLHYEFPGHVQYLKNAALFIRISRKLAPSFFVSVTALEYVLSVVPKQGIVTQTRFSLGIFNISNALAVTNTARVESRPPLIPTTAD